MDRAGKIDVGVSIAAFVLGLAAWLVTCVATGKSEAWDDPAYFRITLWVLGLFVFFLGFVRPAKSLRWGPLAVAGQAVGLLVAGGGGSLLPAGLFLFGLMAIPFALGGWLGGRLGRDRV